MYSPYCWQEYFAIAQNNKVKHFKSKEYILLTNFFSLCFSYIASCNEIIIIFISNCWSSQDIHKAKIITEILQQRRNDTTRKIIKFINKSNSKLSSK